MIKDFEDYLVNKFMELHPCVLDDDIPDGYSDWLGEIDSEDWIKYSEQYAEVKVIAFKLKSEVKE